jgi:hypothetical protein
MAARDAASDAPAPLSSADRSRSVGRLIQALAYPVIRVRRFVEEAASRRETLRIAWPLQPGGRRRNASVFAGGDAVAPRRRRSRGRRRLQCVVGGAPDAGASGGEIRRDRIDRILGLPPRRTLSVCADDDPRALRTQGKAPVSAKRSPLSCLTTAAMGLHAAEMGRCARQGRARVCPRACEASDAASFRLRGPSTRRPKPCGSRPGECEKASWRRGVWGRGGVCNPIDS